MLPKFMSWLCHNLTYVPHHSWEFKNYIYWCYFPHWIIGPQLWSEKLRYVCSTHISRSCPMRLVMPMRKPTRPFLRWTLTPCQTGWRIKSPHYMKLRVMSGWETQGLCHQRASKEGRQSQSCEQRWGWHFRWWQWFGCWQVIWIQVGWESLICFRS